MALYSASSCDGELPVHPRSQLSLAVHLERLSKDGDLQDHLVGYSRFATIRLRLIKVIARVAKNSSHIRLAIASVCPEIGVFKAITTSHRSAPTSSVRRKPSRPKPSPINVEKPLVLAAAINAEADARPDRPTKPETPAVQRAHR